MTIKHALLLALSLSAACVDQDQDDPTASTSAALEGPHNPGIAPLDARPHGHTYAEWARGWQQVIYRRPASASPIVDETGARCADGQSDDGRVWYLAGNHGGTTVRDCTVPAGTALFFPLLVQAYVGWDIDPPDQDYALWSVLIAAGLDGAVVTAEIDGRAVVGADRYRVTSANGPMSLDPDNEFGTTAAECHAEADGLLHCPFGVNNGWYLYLEPLAAGDHTIHFTGALAAAGFTLDVTYHLHVR